MLTEAGLSFRDRAAHICATIDAAREEAAPNGYLRGLLRIAGPASMATQFAPALTGAHPTLHVHMRFSDPYVDLVTEGFDCGIRVGYMPDSNLVARKIGELPVRLYASPEYIRLQGTPETPADVLNHAAIMSGTEAWKFSDGDQSFTVHPQGRFKADHAHMLVEAAAAGLGIVAVGEVVAAPYVAAETLVPIMQRYRLPPVGIFVVRPPSQHTWRKVRILIDHRVEVFSPAAAKGAAVVGQK